MDFLQSNQWRKFQESVGRKTFLIDTSEMHASIIEHSLPIVGKYFYIPRGPEIHETYNMKHVTSELIELAKKEKVGWIRIEPENAEILEKIKKSTNYKIIKAPHDMQPREIFVIDINKPEEQLLSEMKEKTRYNIKLSQKRGVSVKVISNNCHPERSVAESKDLIELDSSTALGMTNRYFNEFLRLVKFTSERNEITAHPAEYYRQMWETIPAENLKLYVAEYQNKIIAANLIVFFEDTAIYLHTKTIKKGSTGENNIPSEKNNNFGVGVYLHGASDNEYRNVMAPYLLQWQAIKDAKNAGYKFYDFGGVSSGPTALNQNDPKRSDRYEKWQGITRFKLGFSPNTEPKKFLGSYDIILNKPKYWIYQMLSWIKSG